MHTREWSTLCVHQKKKKKKSSTFYVLSIYALRVPTLLAASKNMFMLLFLCRTAMVGCLSENQSRQLNTSRYVRIPRYISRFVTTVGPCSSDLSITYTYILGNEKFLQSRIFAGAPLQCISKIVCGLNFCGSLPRVWCVHTCNVAMNIL